MVHMTQVPLQALADKRVKDRTRHFQLMLCKFSVEELRREFAVSPNTIGRWRRGESIPATGIMRAAIKRMQEMRAQA